MNDFETRKNITFISGFDETKMDKFIKQSHQRVKSDVITDLPGAFKSLQPSTGEKSTQSSSEKRKKLSKGAIFTFFRS